MFGFKKGFDKDEYKKIDLPEEDESYLEDDEDDEDDYVEEADENQESLEESKEEYREEASNVQSSAAGSFGGSSAAKTEVKASDLAGTAGGASLSEMFKARLIEKGSAGSEAGSKEPVAAGGSDNDLLKAKTAGGETKDFDKSEGESGGSGMSMAEFFKAKKAEKDSGPREGSKEENASPAGSETGYEAEAGYDQGIESEDEYDDYDEEEEEREVPSWLRWLKRIALGVLILAATLFMTFCFSMYREFSKKEATEGKQVEVEIPKGSSTEKMAEILQDAGVIRYKTAFLAKLYFSDYRGKLRYGTFTLNTGETLDETIEILATGGALKEEVSFMVPEGYSVEMIAEKLEKEGIMDSEEFLNAVTEAADDFVYKDQLPDKDRVFYQLQGYLFPDTYSIAENMTGRQLVDKMLDEFVRQFDKKRQKQAKKLGMSMEEVVIRASLVQKETYNPKDYGKIAGVIDNRLEKGMKLQFDSTVVYAISNGLFGVEKVTYDDLERESPYNTYHVRGLPPGPICNPGLEAIEGVLNAEKHNYLFFRTDPNKDDGSNIFTETYEEHSAAGEETEAATEKAKDNTDTQKKEETKDSSDTKKKEETKDNTNTQ